MKNELKPCPFCGGEAKFIEREEERTCKVSVTTYDVGCYTLDCYLEEGAEWGWDTKEEATEKWNNRKLN